MILMSTGFVLVKATGGRTMLVMEFRDRLIAIRKAARLTQEQVAERCGKGQSWLGNIEGGRNGSSYPRVPDIYLLAKALGVHPGEFFADMPSHSVQSPEPTIELSVEVWHRACLNFDIDLGAGTMGGAVLAAFRRLSRGESEMAALSAILSYANANRGGYAPKESGDNSGSSVSAGLPGQPAA